MNNKYANSNKLLERALKVTPLAAQTFSKSYRYYCEGISPAFIERGEGCYLWDVDGNRFLDFVCALGPITIGYNDARINQAIIEQLQKGIDFSLPAPISVELAEKLTEIIPAAEKVRFVKNGSDATAAAVRLARAYTGREIIAACGYHGMQDWYIGSTTNRRGVPASICELTQNFDYNNLDSIKVLFSRYPGQIAAVILEPIQGNGPLPGYLDQLLELTHREGALLIFDEVVSGFRYALGGASELYNVVPDLVAFGKGIANGMPISAVAGRGELLDLIAEGVFISTTFGGETLSMAAALTTIKILEQPGVYQGIWELGELLLNGLRSLVNQYQLQEVVLVTGLAPHGGVLFEGAGKLDYLEVNSVFQQSMVENGILSVGINNLNLSHTKKEIDMFLGAADQGMRDIREAVEQGSVAGILKGGMVNPVFKRNTR